MTTNERIKEIAIKHLKQCPEKYYIEQNCLTIPEPTVEWMMQAILEANKDLNEEIKNLNKCSFMGAMRDCPTHGESEKLKDLSATIESQKKAIEELKSENLLWSSTFQKYQSYLANGVRLVATERVINDYESVAAISKQRNEL